MAWQHRQTTPTRYGYDSSPYPNPNHQRYPDLPAPQAPVPPFVPPPPPSNLYGPPPSPQVPHYAKSRDYGYDQQQYGTLPSPWRPDHNEARKYDTVPHHSPESRGAHPYHHQTSSTRGGRRPDRTPVQHRPPASSHSSYNPPVLAEMKEPRSQATSEMRDWQLPKSTSEPAHSTTGTKKEKMEKEDKKEITGELEKKSDSDKKKSKKEGDLLSLLANVSSEMDDGKKGSKKVEGKNPAETTSSTKSSSGSEIVSGNKGKKVPPTSPVQRHLQSSPVITPNMSTETDHSHPAEVKRTEEPSHPIKQRVVRTLTPKPITPTAAPHYHHYPQKFPRTPPTHTSYDDRGPPRGGPSYYTSTNSFPPPPPPSQPRTYPPPSYSYGYDSRDPSWEHPQPSPVVVEHNSFDSTDSAMRYHSDYSYGSYPGPPAQSARYYQGESGYYPPETMHGDNRGMGPEHVPDVRTPPSPYPHNRWSSYEGHPPPPSPMNSGHYPAPPTHQQYPPYPTSAPPANRAMGYPTPSPYYQHPPEGPPMDRFPRGSPGNGQPFSPPPHHMQYPMYHPHSGYPPHMNNGVPTYPYAQQQNLDEKIVLKKKFSWKHFPEVSNYVYFCSSSL